MESYVRPAITSPEFRDSDGNVIPYGDRWGMDHPPEDTYSVVTHPERFDPLHEVAEALIAHLVAEFDCTVDDDPEGISQLLPQYIGIRHAVRVIPAADDAAPLTFASTGAFPVVLHAGFLYTEALPPCGCDACDSTWEECADSLEEAVGAVVSGRFTESVSLWRRVAVRHSLTYPGGSRGGNLYARHTSRPVLRTAARRLKSLPDGWQPWPRRSR